MQVLRFCNVPNFNAQSQRRNDEKLIEPGAANNLFYSAVAVFNHNLPEREVALKEKNKVEYFITMGISTVLMALKDETMKRKFKNAFLKVRNAINQTFPDEAK